MGTGVRLKDWKLRHKIILHVTVIGALAASVLAFLFVSTQNRLIRELNLQTFELVGSLIECNVSHRMLKEDIDDIQPTLERVTRTSRILRVRILDGSGRIRNSSDRSEVSGLIPEADRELLAEFYPEAVSDPEPSFTVRPISVSRGFMPIRNQPECMACHRDDGPAIGIIDLEIDSGFTDTLLRRSRLNSLLIALVALIVLVFVILRLFEKIINRPLSNLKREMIAVQEGDFDVRLRPDKQDEIGDLTRSFNVMVRDLQDAHRKIEALHRSQMQRAGQLASMGELAAGLAHEIKNPLSGIKGALEIIRLKSAPEDPTREIFNEILAQIDHIHLLVQDLLDYAKPRPPLLRPADINRCISEAVVLARNQTRDKEIRFDVEELSGDPRIVMDENRIQEVILNLLLNGIAAIRERGTIGVRPRRLADGRLEIAIRDSGVGIRPDWLPKIFQPFFTTRKKGTGLGLSISRQILEAHGGGIEVGSIEGEGTTFTIHLPNRPPENRNAS